MPTGIGLQPAGTSAGGFGAPTQTGRGTAVILPDMKVGGSHGSRRIDPVTRDYVINDDGRVEGMNNVQQLVYLAIANAAPQIQEIDRLDAGFERAMLAVLNAALAPIVAQRLIEVLGVSSRVNASGGLRPGQAVTVLRWRDLTTGIEREEPL